MSAPIPMTLQFLGAAGTVTGSRYLIEAEGRRVLVDCGLFQGYKQLRERNWAPFPVPPAFLDAVVLTHAHLDHSGYLPALVRQGFQGRIHATTGTVDLCGLLLPDSGHLLEEEARFAARRGYSKHKTPLPLYTAQDAQRCLESLVPHAYQEEIPLVPGITARFLPAGHILGAAHIALTVHGQRVHFSGDLGRQHDSLMNPPSPLPACDILLCESTYGNRIHDAVDPEQELGEVVRRVAARGGIVVIPAFAVGRAQALMLHLARLQQRGDIPKLPVFLNSPMAANATQLYHAHHEEHHISADDCLRMFDIATVVNSVEESKALNERHGPMVIISASGMATGGRVLHHIEAFGPDERNAIVLAGYQAGGTRGAALANGARSLRMFGHDVSIRAEVVQLHAFSAHADADELLAWMRTAPQAPRQVYVTHGEAEAADALRVRIERELGWSARVPEHLERVALDALD
ncbi:mRNA 3'-end processing factor [Dyella jiangningensis]|nr:mRNA 3'-end processing factor [Dyella jiangningensis]AHX13422.1 mRNA 3'-end processing factor [Dyella jiangningensis]